MRKPIKSPNELGSVSRGPIRRPQVKLTETPGVRTKTNPSKKKIKGWCSRIMDEAVPFLLAILRLLG